MARSATISTPIPTLEEFGKSLGLSKKRQDSLLQIVRQKSGAKNLDGRHRDADGVLKEKRADLRIKR